MGLEDPSEWSEPEETDEDDKRLRLKRTLMIYAGAILALSILAPLAGFLYVRMGESASVPIPPAEETFSKQTSISPADRAFMPASPSAVLAQQQGEGSLNYVRGKLYSPPAPQPPRKEPVLKPITAAPPEPKMGPTIAATKPAPSTATKPFVPPTLDPGFGPEPTMGSGSAPAPGTSGLSGMSNIGAILKNIPSSIGKSLSGLSNLGNLGNLGGLLGSSPPSNAQQQQQQPGGSQSQPQSSGSAPQLDNSSGL